MINHDHKCIFIHIPRTAGSSIEQWISGQDWWNVNPSTKHLVASQAKSIYADYWDDYFKFSVVRDPVSRVLSCLKYAKYFGLSLDSDGNVDFSQYRTLFGNRIILEHDYRFHKRSNLAKKKHRAHSVYGNILDEKLDLIIKFENLKEGLDLVGEKIGLNRNFEVHIETFEAKPAEDIISKSTLSDIKNLYKYDYTRFYPRKR
ncbi:sulfotransferase family 2 domain-containing protein [Methylobacterium goesingense]|uniref:Sulfotransferase family protein n=2 Tax=Methylobacterium goesingense TaxID=243690 RepID=A0ABV2L2Y5_9HYPH|nr:sulfotransferase family 2 domain-containing protein [Methylobacterium goesingense]GJD74690.1 hypothetical protein CFIICLFH_2925 [Methylobacterium goesingense]